MTSEVVVMNRLGIALASDSASTVHMGGRSKFYHADKLFMLSNHQPVGVMVFNNSSLLGVPWETILKLFRSKLGNARLNHLSEYADRLIEFLNNSQELFPEDVQQKYFLLMLDSFLLGVSRKINADLLAQARNGHKPPREIVAKLEAKVVSETLAEWQKKADVDAGQCDSDVAAHVVGRASGLIHKIIFKHFGHADHSVMTNLYELSRLVISKDEILAESLSGLVIAGFGEKEHFPVMEEYHIGEIYKSKLKYKKMTAHLISADEPAVIKPFAQSDMASTFLTGVSPAYEVNLLREIVPLIMGLPDVVIDGFPLRGKTKKEEYKREVREGAKEAVKALVKRLNAFRDETHHMPILRSIEYLPKNELAHVAASLVNLNSLQKRISISEDETVGGPIDVAVISKGDGFVWVNRKHYFKAELNRHFFRNRMEEGQSHNDGEST